MAVLLLFLSCRRKQNNANPKNFQPRMTKLLVWCLILSIASLHVTVFAWTLRQADEVDMTRLAIYLL